MLWHVLAPKLNYDASKGIFRVFRLSCALLLLLLKIYDLLPCTWHFVLWQFPTLMTELVQNYRITSSTQKQTCLPVYRPVWLSLHGCLPAMKEQKKRQMLLKFNCIRWRQFLPYANLIQIKQQQPQQQKLLTMPALAIEIETEFDYAHRQGEREQQERDGKRRSVWERLIKRGVAAKSFSTPSTCWHKNALAAHEQQPKNRQTNIQIYI